MPPNPSIDRYRFALPEVLEPEDDWCIVIRIPGHSDYLGTLLGHLKALTFSQNFERDDSKTGAATVSRRWSSALYSQPIIRMGCDPLMDVRQNTENPCTLEKTFDDGETWEAWANLQLCPPQVVTSPDGSPWWWNPQANGGSGGWEPVPVPGDVTDETPGPVSPPFPAGSPEYEDDTARCIAAASLADALKAGTGELVQTWIAVEAISVLVIIGGCALLAWLSGGVLLPLAVALVGLAASIEVEVLEDNYNSIDWPHLRDMIYCHMERDGSLTEAGKTALLADMDAEGWQYPGIIPEVNQAEWLTYIIVSMVTAAGLTEDAKAPYTTITPECAPCAWEVTLDFTEGMNSFGLWNICSNDVGALTANGLETIPCYVDPCPTAYQGLISTRLFDAHVTSVTVRGRNDTGGVNMAVGIFSDMVSGRGTSTYIYEPAVPTGDFEYTVSVEHDFNGMEIYGNFTASGGTKHGWVSSVTIAGTGPNPFE